MVFYCPFKLKSYCFQPLVYLVVLSVRRGFQTLMKRVSTLLK